MPACLAWLLACVPACVRLVCVVWCLASGVWCVVCGLVGAGAAFVVSAAVVVVGGGERRVILSQRGRKTSFSKKLRTLLFLSALRTLGGGYQSTNQVRRLTQLKQQTHDLNTEKKIVRLKKG